MKDLKHYIEEKLIVFHPQIDEKLIVNKHYDSYEYHPTKWDELRHIINDRYEELGPGTEKEPINFNDIDVSRMTTFYDEPSNKGIFQETKFEYIDVSSWDVSNVENMCKTFFDCTRLISVGDLSKWNVSNVVNIYRMFEKCINLESIGDLSKWDVSSVEDMSSMFRICYELKHIGNLSKWKVSKVTQMYKMFYGCEKLKSIGDLSKWDVSNVGDMNNMFYGCEKLKSVGDLSNWDISSVYSMSQMFYNSGITNIPKWY